MKVGYFGIYQAEVPTPPPLCINFVNNGVI